MKRLSKLDITFIQKHAETMSAKELSEKLGKDIELIQDYLVKYGVLPPPPKKGPRQDKSNPLVIRKELKTSEAWFRLQQELTTDELRYFEESYVKLMAQFRGDVLSTEETQIFDCIKLEILKSRNLMERRKSRDDIVRLERLRSDYMKKFSSVSDMEEADRDFIHDLELQISANKAAEQSRTSEFVKLQERHDALLKNLKATRDQRVKEIESSKENILALFKALQHKDMQQRESRATVLMQMAIEKERNRLGAPATYLDNSQDRPILNSDTVGNP